jgi:hypothetical protein
MALDHVAVHLEEWMLQILGINGTDDSDFSVGEQERFGEQFLGHLLYEEVGDLRVKLRPAELFEQG